MFRRKRRSSKSRFLRMFISIVVLTAFVGILSISVQRLSSLDAHGFAKIASPLLDKVGVSQKDAGQVAGEFVSRISQTGINQPEKDSSNGSSTEIKATSTVKDPTINSDGNTGETKSTATKRSSEAKVIARVAILADSGDENDKLTLALDKASSLNADYIIHLGDLTAWGDSSSLNEVKSILDGQDIKWYAIPGDHDLAASVETNGGNGLDNFLNVFDSNYKMIEINDVNLLVFDNSANKTPIDSTRLNWFLNNTEEANFVFLSQPIYHKSPTDLMSTMGMFEGEKNTVLYNQAQKMLNSIQNSNVLAVFAADHHMSSVSPDGSKEDLNHYVVGALAKDRNVQVFPRFSLLEVYDDFTYVVTEVIL